MVVAVGVVIAIGLFWVFMTLFMEWQKDVPVSSGMGLGEQYEESKRRSVSAQRRQAAFFRKTVWPVVMACGIALVVIVVVTST